jgi:hypothetical protein
MTWLFVLGAVLLAVTAVFVARALHEGMWIDPELEAYMKEERDVR